MPASQPRIPAALALTSILSRLADLCTVLGSEQCAGHEFNFAAGSDPSQCPWQ